jgi:hypothetical protein
MSILRRSDRSQTSYALPLSGWMAAACVLSHHQAVMEESNRFRRESAPRMPRRDGP